MSHALSWNLASVSTFADPFWDYAQPETLARVLEARLESQLQVASHTRAFRDRVARLKAHGGSSGFRRAFEQLELMSKTELRTLDPDDLLAQSSEPFHMVRGTGGTTGRPVSIFWTRADWLAFTHALLRYAGPLRALGRLRFWNGYHQGHVSGPIFDDLVRMLGGTSIPRHFRATDEQALDDIERLRADALIITPKSGSGKGGSLEDLLSIDPRFLRRLRIKALLVSSTALDAELAEEAREQGVSVITNYYGSTEAAPAGASCEADPTIFHLSQGHVFVEVVDEQGSHVASGERGRVVVSRIGAEHDGELAPARGTQLIRYLNGDSAIYERAPCRCGRSSARLHSILRVSDIEDKLKGGCERWD